MKSITFKYSLDEPVISNYLLTKIIYLLTWLITVNAISFTAIILILLSRWIMIGDD